MMKNSFRGGGAHTCHTDVLINASTPGTRGLGPPPRRCLRAVSHLPLRPLLSCVADVKIRRRRKRKSSEHFSRRGGTKKKMKKKEKEERLKANPGLCVMAAIKVWAKQLLTDSRRQQQTTRPVPRGGKIREVKSPPVCQLTKKRKKKYLCIPARTTPAGRVFRTCGNIAICRARGQRTRPILRTGLLLRLALLMVIYGCQGGFCLV